MADDSLPRRAFPAPASTGGCCRPHPGCALAQTKAGGTGIGNRQLRTESFLVLTSGEAAFFSAVPPTA